MNTIIYLTPNLPYKCLFKILHTTIRSTTNSLIYVNVSSTNQRRSCHRLPIFLLILMSISTSSIRNRHAYSLRMHTVKQYKVTGDYEGQHVITEDRYTTTEERLCVKDLRAMRKQALGRDRKRRDKYCIVKSIGWAKSTHIGEIHGNARRGLINTRSG